MGAALLIDRVSRAFGGILALRDVSASIAPGELVGLIGPNGAGKTTLMNLISGIYPPTAGRILLDRVTISALRPDRIAHLGVARTFQIPRSFAGMTVRENVAAAALFGGPRAQTPRQRRAVVEEVLRVTGLAGRAETPADLLTIAGRKRLELARALAMQPRLLLLDEVMAGLTPREMDAVMRLVADVNRRGLTVVLIEHVMRAVMSLARRVIVLHHGTVLADGPPSDVARDPAVVAAYLGRGASGAGPPRGAGEAPR